MLASPSGTETIPGLRVGDGRGDHVASGPYIAHDKMPALLMSASELPQHVVPDSTAGPSRFRLMDVAVPASKTGLPIEPFFRLHDSPYQMCEQGRPRRASDTPCCRNFDIVAKGSLLTSEYLTASSPGQFIEERYPIPAQVLTAATDGHVTINLRLQRDLRAGFSMCA